MSTKPAKNIHTSKKSLKKNRDFPKDYLVWSTAMKKKPTSNSFNT